MNDSLFIVEAARARFTTSRDCAAQRVQIFLKLLHCAEYFGNIGNISTILLTVTKVLGGNSMIN